MCLSNRTLKNIEIELIYNVVLVSGIEQSDSVIHYMSILFHSLFLYIISYYKTANIVPCAIQWDLDDYLFYIL